MASTYVLSSDRLRWMTLPTRRTSAICAITSQVCRWKGVVRRRGSNGGVARATSAPIVVFRGVNETLPRSWSLNVDKRQAAPPQLAAFGRDAIASDAETTVALVGVHNLIVVRTSDAILICDRHDAEKIKKLVGKLPPELQ